MKSPSIPGARIAILCVLAATAVPAHGQGKDPFRYLIEPGGNPVAISHIDLINSIVVEGADIYLSIDRPNIGGNVAGAFLTPTALANLQAANPTYIIEQDLEVQQNGPPGGPPWSLDRVDQRAGTDGLYSVAAMPDCGGPRVYVYVCDTGIEPNHDEFHLVGHLLSFMPGYVSRGLWDPMLVSPPLRSMGTEYIDPHDHGTGTASCVIGAGIGSARSPINVVSACCYPMPTPMTGPGTFAGYAVEAIDWAADEHYNRSVDGDPYNDASVLLFPHSTTTGRSTILDNAVKRARDAGMVVIVSAGNAGMDAALFSPAGKPEIFTVGASDMTDMKWVGSNFGAVIDLWAPGDMVASASSAGPMICTMVSGTSYSASLVAGAAARILSVNPWATPAQVERILSDPSDPVHGPTSIPGSTAPLLSYIHPMSVPCLPMTYADWARKEELSQMGLLTDVDLDGLNNMLEYFMALDPETNSHGSAPSVSMDDGDIVFAFRLAKYLDYDEFEYDVEVSEDLVTWTELEDAFIMPDATAPCSIGAVAMEARVTPPGEALFMRLVVRCHDEVVFPGGM